MTTKDDGRRAIGALATSLAHMVEAVESWADDLPRSRAGRALAKDLRDLRGRAHAALLRLQGLDADAVLDELLQGEYRILCVCPADD